METGRIFERLPDFKPLQQFPFTSHESRHISSVFLRFETTQADRVMARNEARNRETRRGRDLRTYIVLLSCFTLRVVLSQVLYCAGTGWLLQYLEGYSVDYTKDAKDFRCLDFRRS